MKDISKKIDIFEMLNKSVQLIIIFSCKFLKLVLIFYLLFFKIIPFAVDIIIFRYHDQYTADNVIIIFIWMMLLYIIRIPKLF